MKKDLKEQLLIDHRDLVFTLAMRVKNGCPFSVELSDLVSAGMTGLLEVIQRYSPDKKNSFRTYARPRVLGAMKDWLRKQDHLKRHSRKLVNAIEGTYFSCGPQSLTEDRIAASGLDSDQYHKYAKLVRSEAIPIDNHDLFTSRDKHKLLEWIEQVSESSALDNAIISQQREILLDAMGVLSERQRLILIKHFVQGLGQHEIGKDLGICASRVSQLLTAALLKLRKELAGKGLSREEIHSIK